MKTERFARGDKAVRSDRFANWTEFVNAAAKTEARWIENQRPESRTPVAYGDDFNTASWDDAVKLAREGWREGAERARKLAGRIGRIAEAKMLQAEPRFSHKRGMLNRSRYLSGNPKPFVRMEQTETIDTRRGRKVVRIVVNRGASSGVSAKVIETRGAAVVALVDALERSGRRCEIEVVMAAHNHDDRAIEHWVRVKSASDPLNLENVAFALGHTGTHRRLAFALREALPAADRKGIFPGSYGRTYDVDDHGDIYLSGMLNSDSTWQSEERAAQWVTETLAAQGVEIETAA